MMKIKVYDIEFDKSGNKITEVKVIGTLDINPLTYIVCMQPNFITDQVEEFKGKYFFVNTTVINILIDKKTYLKLCKRLG